MKVITDPRHQNALAREFGIRGPIVVPHLESVIQPVAVVSDLTSNLSPSSIEGAASLALDKTPTAGQFAMLRFNNPVGSNVYALIQGFTVTCPNGVVVVEYGPCPIGTPGGGPAWRNMERAGSPVCVGSQDSVSSSAQLLKRWGWTVARDSTACFIPLPALVPPGSAWAFVSDTVTLELMCRIDFVERLWPGV